MTSLRWCLLAVASLSLGLSSCSVINRFRSSGPPAGDGSPELTPGVKSDFPSAARPGDIAEADAYYKKGGAGGGFYRDDIPLVPGNTAFVVELDQQRAYLYSGQQLVAVTRISSGRPNYRTETGTYTIGYKNADHRSSIYGDFVSKTSGSRMMSDVTQGFDPVPVGGKFQGSLMKYFMRFYRKGQPTAIGLHVGILPGRPASHGCIRLPIKMASWFFKKVPMGTTVSVRGTKNGVPAGTKQPRPKRAPKVHSTLKHTAPAAPATPPAEGEGGASGAPAAPTTPATPSAGAPENTSAPAAPSLPQGSATPAAPAVPETPAVPSEPAPTAPAAPAQQ